MSDIPHLIGQLKKQLKKHQFTYADVAQQLNLSEASVKRLFANNSFTLQRLEQVCHLVGMSLNELMLETEREREKINTLTLEQEKAIVSDIKLLLVTYLVLNRWTFQQILEHYNFTEPELIQLLARLDRMRIIELLPENRIRLITARDFRWIKHGPIESFVMEKVKDAFLAARFEQSEEALKFVSGLLSRNSMLKIKQKLEKMEQEIHQMVEKDSQLPLTERNGFSALLAIRFWDFKEFSALKR